jgi:hypothetical protein
MTKREESSPPCFLIEPVSNVNIFPTKNPAPFRAIIEKSWTAFDLNWNDRGSFPEGFISGIVWGSTGLICSSYLR